MILAAASWGGSRRPTAFLHAEQEIEERPVATQRWAQILGRYIVALGPSRFQLGALVGKDFSQTFDSCSHELIRLFDGMTWLVYKASLDVMPAAAELFQFLP